MPPPSVQDESTYVDPTARLFGQITFGEGCSIWPFVSIRAEVNEVAVGRFTNIQDHVTVHIGFRHSVSVGDYCSITHGATLHGCTVEDCCLVGIGATVMDGAVIGRGSIIGGHSYVREGTVVPPHSIVVGSPARVVRQHDSTIENIVNALYYHRNAQAYRNGDHRVWDTVIEHDIRQEANRIAMRSASAP